MKLSDAVNSPYGGSQQCFCFDKHLSAEEFIEFVENLEAQGNIRLMARQDQVAEELHGFVTMTRQNPPFCDWGNHRIDNVIEHTSIILTLYGKDKPSNRQEVTTNHPVLGVQKELVGDIHTFKKTPLNNSLKTKFSKGYDDFKVRKNIK